VIVTSVSSMTQTFHLRPLHSMVGIAPDMAGILHLDSRTVARQLKLHGHEKKCMSDVGYHAELVVLEFKNPVGMVEWGDAAGQLHRLDLGKWHRESVY